MLGAMSYPLYLIHNKAGKQIYEAIVTETSVWMAMSFAILVVLVLSLTVVHLERVMVRVFKKN